MNSLFTVLEGAVLVFLDLQCYVILARCILSWFASEDSRLLQFCYAVSEPFVAPVRKVLDRIPALGDTGIDFSYMATVLAFTIIRILLLSVT